MQSQPAAQSREAHRARGDWRRGPSRRARAPAARAAKRRLVRLSRRAAARRHRTRIVVANKPRGAPDRWPWHHRRTNP
eukprot:scaffold3334_cov369-Prasinococcus_capsulatus_cf.AAC.11